LTAFCGAALSWLTFADAGLALLFSFCCWLLSVARRDWFVCLAAELAAVSGSPPVVFVLPLFLFLSVERRRPPRRPRLELRRGC
jgi:hypothetical protein